MCKELKTVKTKKTLPKCPNCKEKYELKKVPSTHEAGLGYPYLIIHSKKPCPFGLESYQNSIKECIDSVQDHLKNKFPYLRGL